MGIGYIPRRDSDGNPINDVATVLERDDKGLRTFCGFATTNEAGEAEFCIPIPQPQRFIAYGDMEFDSRHMGDYIKKIRIEDLARLIAWGVALAIDPNATEPVSDATIQAMPAEQLPGGKALPNYPLLGAYEELKFPDLQADPFVKGTFYPGMAMTYQFGPTEATPIGGYGELPGGMYFIVVAQKSATAPTIQGQTGLAGYVCQMSIDWAEKEI